MVKVTGFLPAETLQIYASSKRCSYMDEEPLKHPSSWPGAQELGSEVRCHHTGLERTLEWRAHMRHVYPALRVARLFA